MQHQTRMPKLRVTDKSRKHVWRALNADEVARLLTAAHNGPERYNMSGPARALLYRLATETGLRASELASLMRASFRLDGPEPTVWLPGDDTKNRQPAELPLRAETVAELRELLSDKLPTALVFRMPNVEHLAEMLRTDLDAAGIPYRDDAGRVADFHSLRVSFVTLLAAAGVPAKTLQTLARHSTPVLTMNTYARTLRGSEADAISRLPDFSQLAREARRATGMDSAAAHAKSTGGRTGGDSAHSTVSACVNVRDKGEQVTDSQRAENTANQGVSDEST